MSATLQRPHSEPHSQRPQSLDRRKVVVHAEGPADRAVNIAVAGVVPEHLLDGGEIVHLAIKPSMWSVLLVSGRWILLGVAMYFFSCSEWCPLQFHWYVYQAGFWIALGRLGWAVLEWVSTLYVLTNLRVMRLRGVFNVELFECRLQRVQNTFLTLSFAERLIRIGTITFQTAGQLGTASWRMVAHPWEVHEQVVAAIHRAQDRISPGAV
jgi:hypothetical protein